MPGYEGVFPYAGEILLVGITYDRKDKHHSCVMEKLVKPKIDENPF